MGLTEPGARFSRNEVGSIYVDAEDQFVVSFITSYGGEASHDGVKTAKSAGHWALELTRDEGCPDTKWFVYDRVARVMHEFNQSEIEEDDDE